MRCASRTCWRPIRTITPPRSSATGSSALRAPRGCNCNRAPSANISTTRPANTPASATPSWGRRVRRTITAIWPGSMAAPGSGGDGRSLNFQQRLAVDLAGAGLRQLRDESDLARIFVGQQFCLDVILQPSCRLRRVEGRTVHDHHRLQRHAAVRQFDGEHRAFAHVGVFGEAKLDLERIDPLPGDLDQVIGAAAEEMEAVGVAHKAVAGIDPSAVADGFRGLVRPVPVQRRGGIAAYPQDALFVVADLAAVLVFQTDFIAGHAQPGGAELFPLRPVAEIDVQHFGRSQPFDDLKSGEPLPAVEDFGGKYLGGG